MNFIKGIDTDGNTRYINLEKVMEISKYPNDNIKFLMGAGLYFEILPHTIENVNICEVLERW